MFASRIKRLAAAASDQGSPRLLVTNPLDVGYLTGFLGGDSYLLVGGRRATIVSDRRFEEELESVRGLCDVFIRTNQTLLEAVGQLVLDDGIGRLGVQGEHLTLHARHMLGQRCKGIKLIETSGLVSKLRAKKDPSEVELIRRANRIGEKAMLATLPEIEKAMKRGGGISEAEIAAILEHHMKSQGSSMPSFETIVAAGAHGSLPHYRPDATKLRPGKTLLIDWGATWRGYHGDMTRTFAFGKWPRVLREVYQIVLDAHELAAGALRAGKTGREIDALAREHITRCGYGPKFAHSLGHGLGFNVHEGPRLSYVGEPEVLEAGHVVTVEPGVYLPGVGGVRIEDNYLITAKGAENLCTLPRTLEWATR